MSSLLAWDEDKHFYYVISSVALREVAGTQLSRDIRFCIVRAGARDLDRRNPLGARVFLSTGVCLNQLLVGREESRSLSLDLPLATKTSAC